jgi:ubiquinone/menaquinone biosynthesis C-methylase UbiE
MAEERQVRDVWAIGAAYESYIGRWSRLVARELLRWLGVPPNSRWLDVGCGTGTLVEAIVEHAAARAWAVRGSKVDLAARR